MIANTALKLVVKKSDRTLLRTIKFIELISRGDKKQKVRLLRKSFENGNPQFMLIKRLFKESNPVCITKLIDNLLYNNFTKGLNKRYKLFLKGIHSPVITLISPTMRCNLKCSGCYAMNYKREDELSYDEIDGVIKQCKNLGNYFITFLGGEPFIRKGDILKLLEKNSDCYFQIYTNCWLVDEELIKNLSILGNAFIITSIEGFEKETDDRRGKGTYKKIMNTLDLLQRYGVPHGYSAVVTNKNWELLTSKKFVDLMIEKGMTLGWNFLYMPIGDCPNPGLMPTPEQRADFGKRIREIRSNREIMLLDFWNDAPLTDGCISGRYYCHITSKGDIEPCIFTHFAVDNIKNTKLKDAFNSEFFKSIREKHKQNCKKGNFLLPCILIDYPEDFREIYNKFKPRATHYGAETLVKDKKLLKNLDEYAKGVNKIFPKVWEDYLKENPWCNPGNKNC